MNRRRWKSYRNGDELHWERRLVEKKRILLVIDWILKPTGWSFLDAISSLGYSCDVLGADIPMKYGSKWKKVLSLWPGYFKLGCKAYLRRKDCDVVVAWQSVAGLWYAVFKRLLFAKGAKTILLGFHYTKRKKAVLNNWLKYHFIKFALRAVDYAFCFSSKEAEKHNRLFRCS